MDAHHFAEFVKEAKSFDKIILGFDRDIAEYDFVPEKGQKRPNGTYITIRCGLSGIYQTLNQWKDDKWLNFSLDGSKTIAFSRNPITLNSLK